MKSILFPLTLLGLLTPLGIHGQVASSPAPVVWEAEFEKPPDSAKPWTWWHWINGNITKEGITADLEAMQRIGLGGAQIFTIAGGNVAAGPIRFQSPEWRALVQHALQEAKRLNLVLSMAGCDGWSETGGPWVTPAESMQKVVWSERQVSGGRTVALDLPQPETIRGVYTDIALYAFPVIEGSATIAPSKVTASDPGFLENWAFLSDVPGSTLTFQKPAAPEWILIEYPTAVTFRSLSISRDRKARTSAWRLSASEDGVTFKEIALLRGGDLHAGFPAVTSRFFRLWRSPMPAGASEPSLTAVNLGGAVLDQLQARSGLLAKPTPFTTQGFSPQETIAPEALINLTGRTEWQAPPGNWTLLRIGHTSTGATTHPSTTDGLECDKLNPVAVKNHMQNMYGAVLADSPEMVGTTFKYVLLDSWEAQCQNWTPLMAEEFRKRRGYDLQPWLPALTGRVIDSTERTLRFLWDFRRTIADLMAEAHYGTIQDFAHRHRMELSAEAVGTDINTVADPLLCKKYTDIPMGEFWVDPVRDRNIDDPKEAASAAHLYGKRVAGAEAFTSIPQGASWKNDPYSLKALGDSVFCTGINRFIFHRYVHQPWLDRVPGVTLGPWGINFERTNTWWEPGAAWIQYLSRCQYLLQQGTFQADLCYFYGEDAPKIFTHKMLSPSVPKGYDYDICNADILLNLMEVDGGLIKTPSGMSYRMLVLPPTDRLTLPVLQKVAKLVQDGATVYGQKPERSPSLTGYPESEAALTKLAADLWGPCDGKTVTEHAYGKGKIVWGVPLERSLGVAPDFIAKNGKVLFIHRAEKQADIYFVSNQDYKALLTDCSFRVTGKIPELWYPETGKRETVAFFKSENGQTTFPIRFDPAGSVFVIFRQPATVAPPLASLQINGEKPLDAGGEGTAIRRLPTLSGGKVEFSVRKSGSYEAVTGTGKTVKGTIPDLPAPAELTGPWKLAFPADRGAPAEATFDRLISWSESPEEGIRYFSGTATYQTSFTLPGELMRKDRRIYIDLGDVKNLAELSLNGKPLGVLWKPPFEVEITQAVQTGVNHLEIKVTNLWPNRLIGDQKRPKDQRITWTTHEAYKADSPLLASGLLGPVKVVCEEVVTLSP